MYKIDFGPDWFWILAAICAVGGFFFGLYKLVMGIIWLFNHVNFY